MLKARILLITAIWLAILPYLGFPYSWKDILTTISAFGLMYLSYALYTENKAQKKDTETFDNFSENNFLSEEKIK